MYTPPKWLKPAVFVLCLLPLLILAAQAGLGKLGANPIEKVIHVTGDWALRFLLITLTVTPLRDWLDWAWLMTWRRMLGLYAFFYACLHLLAYVVLDQFFAWRAILADILERPYITVGMIGFVLLIPLALTSNNTMMRRLKKRWVMLHRLIYLIAVCGVLHYLWLVKADLTQPLIYGGILAILLAYRVWKAFRKPPRFIDIT